MGVVNAAIGLNRGKVLKHIDNDTRKRIGQLIPTLSSPVAGEVAATVAAIGRVLASAGNDWHDLAGVFSDPGPSIGERAQKAAAQSRWAQRAPPKSPIRTGAKADGVLSSELRDVITCIIGRNGDPIDQLGDVAGGFIEGLRNRCDKYSAVRLTPKQDRWLRNLAQAAGAEVPWDEIE